MKQPNISFLYGIIATIFVVAVTVPAYATTMTVDIPNLPLQKEPPSTNATEDVNIIVRPGELLPANRTVISDLEGINDVDFRDTPPAGVTVIMNNDTAIITNQTVDIQGLMTAPSATTTAAEETVPAPANPAPPAPPADEPPADTGDGGSGDEENTDESDE